MVSPPTRFCVYFGSRDCLALLLAVCCTLPLPAGAARLGRNDRASRNVRRLQRDLRKHFNVRATVTADGSTDVDAASIRRSLSPDRRPLMRVRLSPQLADSTYDRLYRRAVPTILWADIGAESKFQRQVLRNQIGQANQELDRFADREYRATIAQHARAQRKDLSKLVRWTDVSTSHAILYGPPAGPIGRIGYAIGDRWHELSDSFQRLVSPRTHRKRKLRENLARWAAVRERRRSGFAKHARRERAIRESKSTNGAVPKHRTDIRQSERLELDPHERLPTLVKRQSYRRHNRWERFAKRILPEGDQLGMRQMSMQDAKRAINDMTASSIGFDLPDGWCQERTHLVAANLMRQGVQAHKIQVFAPLKATTDDHPLGQISWQMHIAPAAMVQTKDGRLTERVLDPSISDLPLTRADWLARINAPRRAAVYQVPSHHISVESENTAWDVSEMAVILERLSSARHWAKQRQRTLALWRSTTK